MVTPYNLILITGYINKLGLKSKINWEKETVKLHFSPNPGTGEGEGCFSDTVEIRPYVRLP